MKNFYTLLLFILTFDLYANMIAPINQALTLSQIKQNNQIHTLLVHNISDKTIDAINLSKLLDFYPDYSLDVFKGNKDFSYFIKLIETGEQIETFHISELLPATFIKTKHIGAAGNYPEHANETSLDPDNVFIFPKLGKITPTHSTIQVHKTDLLDYEVEVCATFDRDLFDMDDYNNSIVGIFICNDWSDRSHIIRKFDANHPELAAGLTDAKSKPGYYQAGSFMLVPYNHETFLKEIDLTLTLNNEIKQNQNAAKMILSIKDLVEMTFSRGHEYNWYFGDENIAIIPSGFIEKGMTILTGTPEGVLFRPPSTTLKLGFAARYIITGILGPFYHQTITDYIREKYIKKLIRKKVFLRPGDQIISSGTYLGNIKTKIIPSNQEK